MSFRKAIVTGAAGFSGAVLTSELRKKEIEVCAVIRPESGHNERLDRSDEGLTVVECPADSYDSLDSVVPGKWDVMFHLMWTGDKDVRGQIKNVDHSLNSLEAAKKLGCRRFICTGSQAEYGVVTPNVVIREDLPLKPFSAYGSAKVAACCLTRIRAEELGVEWIWGRIFSLIGKYEPRGRMLPDLYCALKQGEKKLLSSCRQNWDYLDVHDAADALISLGEKGRSGEIYNIANGDYRELKEYVALLEKITGSQGMIEFGKDPDPFVSLQPSVDKIHSDTGWKARRSFFESVMDYSLVYS